MKVEVKINKNIEVDVDIEDVILEINEMPIRDKWNIIGKILNSIETGEVDKIEDDARKIIIDFLKRKLNEFNPSK